VSNISSERASALRRGGLRFTGPLLCLVAFVIGAAVAPCAAETLPDARVKAYQSNPQLNADRARQRGTDENLPQALAGYRPQVIASLSAGLQAVRNLLPDNTIQVATLRPWTIGVTVSDGGTAASQTRQAKELASQSRMVLEQVRNQARTAVVSAWVSNEGTKVALAAAESEVRAADTALQGVRRKAATAHDHRCPQRAA